MTISTAFLILNLLELDWDCTSKWKLLSFQGLGEDICHLVLRGYKPNFKHLVSNSFANKMKINFNMCLFVHETLDLAKDKLLPSCHTRDKVMDWNTPSSRSSNWTHMTSAMAFANDLYSDSVHNCETIACFLELHEIRFGPKNIA